LGAGFGASLLLMADCQCTIPGDRRPVTDSQYTTNLEHLVTLSNKNFSHVQDMRLTFSPTTSLLTDDQWDDVPPPTMTL